jgi:hypothetical protein
MDLGDFVEHQLWPEFISLLEQSLSDAPDAVMKIKV